jgi:hypothetical protein
MGKAEYSLLCESIREYGFDEARPIILYDGKILDGRHRYEACMDLGVEPFFMETTLEGTDPFDYVWRLNAAQRNWLSSEQKVLVGDSYRRESAAWRAEREKIRTEANLARSEAAKGQLRDKTETGKTVFGSQVTGQCDPSPENPSPSETKPFKSAHPTRALIAQEEHVSESAVKRAETIKTKSPELADKVAAGEMRASAALREIKRQETVAALEDISARKAKELEGVYDVIVIDPPWPGLFRPSAAKVMLSQRHRPHFRNPSPASSPCGLSLLPLPARTGSRPLQPRRSAACRLPRSSHPPSA